MQNILIVCADKDLRKDISRILATKFNCLYVDVDEVLDFELLNHQDISISEAKSALRKLEQKSINRVLSFNNCIITMSRDLFVANDNFRLLNDYTKIFISLSKAYFVARSKSEDKYKIEQELMLYDKINKLISSNCELEISKDIKSVEEIGKEIIDKLKKS